MSPSLTLAPWCQRAFWGVTRRLKVALEPDTAARDSLPRANLQLFVPLLPSLSLFFFLCLELKNGSRDSKKKVSFRCDINSSKSFSLSAPFGSVHSRPTPRQSVLHFAALPELRPSVKSSSTICEALTMIRAQPRGSVQAQVLFCASL